EYFFFHGPEVLTRDTFSEYYNVLPMPKELNLHYGEELSYEKNQKKFNYLVYLVDSVNTTYPMEFLDFLFFPGISVTNHRLNIVVNDIFDLFVPRQFAELLSVEVNSRFAIHRLNSLRNDMMLFVEMSERSAPVLQDFDESITELREQWFDLNQIEQEKLLLARLRDSITASFKFVNHIKHHLVDIGVEVNDTGRYLHPHDIYYNEYRPDWEVTKAESDTCQFYRDDRLKTCVLPQTVTVNNRLRSNYISALNHRDKTKRRRDESMETYKYHPLRAQYKAIMQSLFGLKSRLSR
ncbi:MAG: hypothetical protein ABEI86_11980, partial [Halobacteriaceae archaeon]